MFSDIEQLKPLIRISKYSENLVKTTFIKYLNQSKLDFNDLKLYTVDKVIDYFESHCKELTKFNCSLHMPTQDKSAFKKIAHHFPNISDLVLNRVGLADQVNLNDLNNLKIKKLELNYVRNVESLCLWEKLNKLESIALHYCQALNLNMLKSCPSLRELKLQSMNEVKLNFLGECKALEVLCLKYFDDSDFLFLKDCPKLHTLKIYGRIRDSKFLLKMPALEKLYISSEAGLTSSTIEALKKKGVEIIVTKGWDL